MISSLQEPFNAKRLACPKITSTVIVFRVKANLLILIEKYRFVL